MIEIKNLGKMYGKQTVFNNTSFVFPDNGLVCILGPSGCGKSTLLNMIAGFDSNYSGRISVLNTEINTMNSEELCEYRRNNIGFIFQNYNLLQGYTVAENILLACELNNSSDNDNTKKLNTLLEKLNMVSKANEKVENLSGGQKQRVAIARALINNPTIILADEPTGALDRKNATEIMELLKEISKERLVLVITHDKKICEFADKILSIQNGQIVGDEAICSSSEQGELKFNKAMKVSAFRRGFKNLKVHIKRYIAVSLAISIGILAFMFSLSSGNVMEKSISDFKEKNTAVNNGYIKVKNDADKILKLLQSDNRIENIYKQYAIKDISITIDDKVNKMTEKYPMPKATENMSYGIMPKLGQNQISLSPSLAKKFNNDINKLIGKKVRLNFYGREYNLTISGIFNAGYDDFFVSSDIEQKFYENLNKQKVYSISYDVKNFEDIVVVNEMIKNNDIKAETSAKEVGALQSTFGNLSRLFLTVSVLILLIGLFISVILLVKLQNSRYREIGLLSALGFTKNKIRSMIINENIFLVLTTVIFNAVFIEITNIVSGKFNAVLTITVPQIVFSLIGTGIAVILISVFASYKLLNTEPADALRK